MVTLYSFVLVLLLQQSSNGSSSSWYDVADQTSESPPLTPPYNAPTAAYPSADVTLTYTYAPLSWSPLPYSSPAQGIGQSSASYVAATPQPSGVDQTQPDSSSTVSSALAPVPLSSYVALLLAPSTSLPVPPVGDTVCPWSSCQSDQVEPNSSSSLAQSTSGVIFNVPLTPSVQPSAPPTPSVQSSAPPTPPVQSSAPPTPPVQSSAPPTPPVESSAPPTPPVQSSAPPTPPVESSAPPTPPVQSSAPPTPPVESSAPPTPPVQSSTPPTPPVESSAPPTPPVQSSTPPTPPVESSAPPTPPVQSSTPPTPPVQSSAPPTPPVQSSTPMLPRSVSSTTAKSIQPTPTIVVVPSPTPLFNVSSQEIDAVRRAKCHSWCISNYVSKVAQNTFIQTSPPGSPTWLIMPDTYLCAISTTFSLTLAYSSVWECRDTCVYYGNWNNCSSACNSNCTNMCRFGSQLVQCLRYYTTQPQQCQTRICSTNACAVGCNRTLALSFGLPSQYRPLGPPQLIGTIYANVYLLNITSAVPSPTQTPLLSSLVVRVQPVGGEAPPTYYWLVSTENPLNLSAFAGLNVNISFAAVSYLYGAVVYSNPLTVWIPDKFPSQLTTFTYNLVPDARMGFFGYIVLSLSWGLPAGANDLNSYNVSFSSMMGSSGSCTPSPAYRIVSPSANNFTLMALRGIDGLKCGCGINVQIFAIPVLPSLAVPMVTVPSISCNGLANASNINLQCTSKWNMTSSMFTYNLTWTLNFPPYVMVALTSNATVNLLVPFSGRGGGVRGVRQAMVPILANQTMYTFMQNYIPDVQNGWYNFSVSFITQFPFPIQQFFGQVSTTIQLVKSCSLVAVPPVSDVNVTTPTSQWTVLQGAGTLAVLSLGMQLNWMPPAANITSYNVWVGTQPIASGQSSQLSGKVQSFQVQSSNIGKRQAQTSMGMYTILINITLDRTLLGPSLTLYIQLQSVNSIGVTSEWSPPTSIVVAVNLSIPLAPSTVVTLLQSSPSATSASVVPLQTATAAPAINGPLTLLLAIIIPSGAVLLLAIFIVLGVMCFIRSKNKVILGEQTNLGISGGIAGGRPLHDLLEEKITMDDDWELDPSDVVVFVDQKLGEGAFGEVYKGTVSGSCLMKNLLLSSTVKKAAFIPVAIKVLKSGAHGKEKQDFMNEIEMMKRITSGNPHIVSMIGCVTRSEPVCLMCELVTYGSLLSYLRTHQKKGAQKVSELSRVTVNTNGSVVGGGAGRTGELSNEDAAPYLEPGSEYSHLEESEPEGGLGPLEENDLIAFAYQIADGMQHLASLNIVHRDLACRNVLIGENKTLKITDFGLSREVEEVYEVKGKRKLPWRWMAIESLERRIFTTYSDVWSFGITLWEISTFGGFPYPSVSNDDLLTKLKAGYRMEKPENCSNEVYIVMLECWSEDTHERPSFSHLKSKFDLMLQLSASERDQPYIELSLDTNQYVYIPDGIEEDDDPNKGTFTKPVTSPKAGAQPPAVGALGRGVVSGATPTEHSRRGVCLARLGSNNSYIDCPPLPHATSQLDVQHEEESKETEL